MSRRHKVRVEVSKIDFTMALYPFQANLNDIFRVCQGLRETSQIICFPGSLEVFDEAEKRLYEIFKIVARWVNAGDDNFVWRNPADSLFQDQPAGGAWSR